MFIVVGTGRCGSSMVAGILDRLGVNMGKDSLPADHINKLGYYEDVEFDEPMELLLGDRMTLDVFMSTLDRLGRARGEPWGFKNPKSAYLIPHLYRAFPDAKWIWVKRNFVDTVESTIKAYAEKIGWGFKTASSMVLGREACLDRYLPIDAYEIQYEDALENPRSEVQQLCSYFELPYKQEAVDFIGSQKVPERVS